MMRAASAPRVDVHFSQLWGGFPMQDTTLLRQRAAADLAPRLTRLHAADVVDGLAGGLALLSGLLEQRLHVDLERQFGVDSMVAPMTLSQAGRQLQRAATEIDAYSAVVVEEEVGRGLYVADSGAWVLDWALQLRLGDAAGAVRAAQAEAYRGLEDRPRRLRFASQLRHAVPESVRMPGVVLKLYALGVRIAAALAFGDAARADQLRAEQIELVPAIGDCPDCRGRVLMNGMSCAHCGNPLWTYAWLRSD